MKHRIAIPALNSLEIFAHQLAGDKILLYAPFANTVVESCRDEILDLEQKALNNIHSEELVLLSAKEEKLYRTSTPENITELSVLINQRCNFSCAYCYSADGRDNKEMSLEQLTSIIDWFVDERRGTELDIIFSGGGDPILSFTLLRQGIEYASNKAWQKDIQLNWGIVTNGSTITDEQLDFIEKYKINLVVSFDIIEEVHNKQRSHYDVVSATIDRLCCRNMPFGIRSTITPLNVNRQEEMVNELHQRFPLVKSAAFEVVLNKDLFATAKELELFYRDFANGLFAAQQLGNCLGLEIGNTMVNNINSCKERACLGKLVATPYGHITACSRISSPKEKFFNIFSYGKIDSSGIQIDDVAINRILSENVTTHNECSSCIAKWHCSGGCLLARHSLPDEFFSCYCKFMKQMVVQRLLQMMD